MDMKQKITLIHGDCLEKMKDIDDNSIELVLTDPPYNISKAKWDKWKTVDDYVNFMGNVFLECQRTLKDNGSFYFFHNDFEQMAELQHWIKNNTKFIFKQMITWNKKFKGCSNEGFLQGFNEVEGLRNYQKMAEYCLFYTFQDDALKCIYESPYCFKEIKEYLKEERIKTKLTINEIGKMYNKFYNIKDVKDNRRIIGHYFKNSQWCLPTKDIYENILQKTGFFSKSWDELKEKYDKLKIEYENLKYTYNNQKENHSVFNYEIAKKIGHLTPKPTDMLSYIIKTSSNKNEIILDPFMGSCSTGISCLDTERNFIGIEKDDKYFEISVNRIKDYIKENNLKDTNLEIIE